MAKIIKKLQSEETKFSSDNLVGLPGQMFRQNTESKEVETLVDGKWMILNNNHITEEQEKRKVGLNIMYLYQDYIAQREKEKIYINDVWVSCDDPSLDGFIKFIFTTYAK